MLNRLKKPKITVGIDGSVYRFNQPYFGTMLSQTINALLESPCEVSLCSLCLVEALLTSVFSFQFSLKLSSDGSGRGAALVAAVAARLVKERRGPRTKRAKASTKDENCVMM